jgi:hypothetical protein
MIKIRTTVPVIGEREKWLDEHYPKWDIVTEDEFFGSSFTRARWYIKLPDKLATMYLLRWA